MQTATQTVARITLATLPNATAQEVFDQGARHLLKQNAQSLKEGSDSTCMYRGADGLQCVGGCFIADSEYDGNMEGTSWDSLSYPVPGEHTQLIRKLQMIHDNHEPAFWPHALRMMAGLLGLSDDAVNQYPVLASSVAH